MDKAVMAATLGGLLIGGALAQTAAVLPPVQKSSHVEYMSGGIGKMRQQPLKMPADIGR